MKRAARIRAEAGSQGDELVTEDDLRDLPEAIGRYMKFSGALGKKRISAVHLLHSGQFKPGPNRRWLPIRGEYFITTKKPSFLWYGRVGWNGFSIVARDSYVDGRGRIQVKALSLIPIVDDESDTIARSAFGRCVAELTLAPTFFLDRTRVQYTHAGRDHARCIVTDGAFSTEADLFVHADGSLDRIVVMRYFDRGGGRATLERFTGAGSHPKLFGGRMLASKIDGFWNLADSDLHYVSFDIDHVEFE